MSEFTDAIPDVTERQAVLCDHWQCGRPQMGPGHPRNDWLRMTITGSKEPARWYCSPRCFAAAYGLLPDAAPNLATLNRLAHTYMTVMTATPERVQHALEHAFRRLVAEIANVAYQDRRDRPTFQQVVDELQGML